VIEIDGGRKSGREMKRIDAAPVSGDTLRVGAGVGRRPTLNE
jgi:hypothetical protein